MTQIPILFFSLFLFFIHPLAADTGFKPIVLGAIAIFIGFFLILGLGIAGIHRWFANKVFLLSISYKKSFLYTILGSLPGIFVIVMIEKNSYSEFLFLKSIFISMFFCPLLMFIIQKILKKEGL
ncbi:MAG TPA: hypothetical protein PK079_22800 [Leptospiraceae bacterium]|nr:hypothetical protein [Leptospiraceae bacterium]HMW08438.1 hypothetical protein [Leptospiraceae bacterium]HMY34265.1 hypothetical protein [Leptospiraceae bacterium]HMZ67238.1 hypothetical protein [Leptospiraceae bacterium]HNA10012.1 hypothetical protein [Leptospiraceae bacterium]